MESLATWRKFTLVHAPGPIFRSREFEMKVKTVESTTLVVAAYDCSSIVSMISDSFMEQRVSAE